MSAFIRIRPHRERPLVALVSAATEPAATEEEERPLPPRQVADEVVDDVLDVRGPRVSELKHAEREDVRRLRGVELRNELLDLLEVLVARGHENGVARRIADHRHPPRLGAAAAAGGRDAGAVVVEPLDRLGDGGGIRPLDVERAHLERLRRVAVDLAEHAVDLRVDLLRRADEQHARVVVGHDLRRRASRLVRPEHDVVEQLRRPRRQRRPHLDHTQRVDVLAEVAVELPEQLVDLRELFRRRGDEQRVRPRVRGELGIHAALPGAGLEIPRARPEHVAQRVRHVRRVGVSKRVQLERPLHVHRGLVDELDEPVDEPDRLLGGTDDDGVRVRVGHDGDARRVEDGVHGAPVREQAERDRPHALRLPAAAAGVRGHEVLHARRRPLRADAAQRVDLDEHRLRRRRLGERGDEIADDLEVRVGGGDDERVVRRIGDHGRPAPDVAGDAAGRGDLSERAVDHPGDARRIERLRQRDVVDADGPGRKLVLDLVRELHQAIDRSRRPDDDDAVRRRVDRDRDVGVVVILLVVAPRGRVLRHRQHGDRHRLPERGQPVVVP
jgi:hypothetical protein